MSWTSRHHTVIRCRHIWRIITARCQKRRQWSWVSDLFRELFFCMLDVDMFQSGSVKSQGVTQGVTSELRGVMFSDPLALEEYVFPKTWLKSRVLYQNIFCNKWWLTMLSHKKDRHQKLFTPKSKIWSFFYLGMTSDQTEVAAFGIRGWRLFWFCTEWAQIRFWKSTLSVS